MSCVVYANTPAQTQAEKPKQIEVNSLVMKTTGKIRSEELLSRMATQASPWGVWIFLNENLTEKLGAPRCFFNQNIFNQDINQIREYLTEYGYFNSIIDTVLSFASDAKKINIQITIDEGNLSFIDSVRFDGINGIDSTLLSTIKNSSFIALHKPYNRQKIIDEQNRIVHLLTNSGYPLAEVDSVSQVRYASTNNISVVIRFRTGKKYLFGDIHIPKERSGVEDEVLLRQLDFQTGEIYNEEKRLVSEQNLNRLGLFESVNLQADFSSDSGSALAPLRITVRNQDLQEIKPELLALNENNANSIGLGLGYKHRNFFGGARNFSITANGRLNQIERYFDYLLDRAGKPITYSKAELQSQLIFPYFYSNKTSANITFTGEAERQKEYTLNTLRAKVGFVTQMATYTIGSADLNIERVDPKFTNASLLKVEDTTKQFNVIEALTLQRDKTNNIFSPSAGFFHSISFEEAGLINTTLGGLGLPYSEYFKITFLGKQFISTGDLQNNIFAFKLRAGYAELYNPKNRTPVPLPRRFFVGGSGSVRGWKDRTLSAFSSSNVGGNVVLEGSIEQRLQWMPNGGKLFNTFEMQRFWSVLFLDYGNTWLTMSSVKVQDIALAVGIGLRYETFVGPLRIDVAWRLYDPDAPRNEQWLTQHSFFTTSYSLIHFGIG
ncbi:MAG: BamA/TamA family outer membrane protein, partial [Bacteroidetes bacterium]|nr:BamA/TamA family outer membrane protein [Bacteroidota bacterium]